MIFIARTLSFQNDGYTKLKPFVADFQADLKRYVIDEGMIDIFRYLAQEDEAIRQNSAKRTTEQLKTLFGSK